MRVLPALLIAIISWGDAENNQAYPKGYALYQDRCMECHVERIDPNVLMKNFEANNTILQLKAPSMNMLSFRLKQVLGDPEDEELQRWEIAGFLRDYLYNPSPDKSICIEMVGASFSTKESMLGKINEEDIQKISEWLYNHTPYRKEE